MPAAAPKQVTKSSETEETGAIAATEEESGATEVTEKQSGVTVHTSTIAEAARAENKRTATFTTAASATVGYTATNKQGILPEVN